MIWVRGVEYGTAAELAAKFGRWGFYAGWILGMVLVGLARLLDWPDWMGAAVALAVPFAAHRLTDRIAHRLMPRTETTP